MIKELLLISALTILCLSGQAQEPKIIRAKEKKIKQFTKSGFYTYIPGGTFTKNLDQTVEATTSETTQVQVNDFIMKTSEVSNLDYLEFMTYYKNRDPEKYLEIRLDTTVWRSSIADNEPMVDLYFRHPAYRSYPVVGVTYAQAKAYCAWLTELINAKEDRAFKKVLYRLPTEEEWIYAANGGRDGAIYPWEGDHLMTADGEYKANCLTFLPDYVYCDTLYQKNENGAFEEVVIYRTFPADYSGARAYLNDVTDYTAKTASYYPNGFGLYNMAGNVAEYVAEQGVLHGGSFKDAGVYLRNQIRQYYTDIHQGASHIGFRYVIEVLEYE